MDRIEVLLRLARGVRIGWGIWNIHVAEGYSVELGKSELGV